MNPIRVPGDRLFGKPENWNEARDGYCGLLPVFVSKGCCLSVWKFSEAERARIAGGANVVLSVVGGQPPVNMTVEEIDGPIVPLNPEPVDL